MATIAVFLAMGGAAYAALGKNSIKAKQIAPNAVGASEIKSNAVKPPEIATNAVQGPEVQDLVYTPITTFGAGCSTASTSAGYFAPGAAIDAEGVVHLRGAVGSAVNVYTLPSQFRPSKAVEAAGFNGGTEEYADGVFIETDGNVSYTAAAGIKSLDGITYTP